MYSDDCDCRDCKAIRRNRITTAAPHICDTRHSETGARCGLFAGHIGSHEGWDVWPATGRSGWIRWTT